MNISKMQQKHDAKRDAECNTPHGQMDAHMAKYHGKVVAAKKPGGSGSSGRFPGDVNAYQSGKNFNDE